jgi:DNA recombination protein RmuC
MRKSSEVLGHSINDLNNLLKLPHLRGQFGEASLERLLADFLPAHMFALQSSPGEGGGRADAVIYFPGGKLPIDAKFPREQVNALFESNDKAEIEAARISLVRVMKAEAKRIQQYIHPENGTTEIALMDLPSETLYMEVIRNRELVDWMNEQHVFPVSPNTLLMTLHTLRWCTNGTKSPAASRRAAPNLPRRRSHSTLSRTSSKTWARI